MLQKQFEEFQKQTRDLLNKEAAYEDNLENQEKIRLFNEKSQMSNLLKKEEQRANDLANELANMGNDNSFKMKERAIKRKIKTMMDDIQKKINDRRSNLISKLQRMRKIHTLDQKMAAKKLIEIKKNMGKKLTNLAKKGDPKQCFNPKKNQLERNQYCEGSFKDLDLQKECKDPKQFCYLCCDKEIGKMNKENRNCCYNQCDSVKNSKSCDNFVEFYHIVHHAHLGVSQHYDILN